MGIYSKDLYSSYLQIVQENNGDLSAPFNLSQRNKTANANIDSALSHAAKKIQQRLNKFAKLFPPLPEDRRQRNKIIHSFSILFKRLVKELKNDLKEDENVRVYAKNFLWNALNEANLLSNDTGLFFTNILSVLDHPPKERIRVHTQLLVNQLQENLTKDKLFQFLRLYGEAYFVTIMIAYFRNRPHAQNEIAKLVNKNYTSLRDVNLAEEDQQLKRILEGPVFAAFKLPKLENACLLREFASTVNGTIIAMRILTDAALPPMINHFTKKERAKLQFFLVPYWNLSSMSNPFFNYDNTVAHHHGLATVKTTSGDQYVGLTRSNQETDAEAYVTMLKSELTDSLETEDAFKFVNALAMCGASYKYFEKFILELKTKYKVNDKSHHLFEFFSLCDGSQDSIAIKSVQNMPKLLLIASQLFGKQSAQQQWFKNGVEAANSMSMSAYSKEIMFKEQCGSRQMHKIESQYINNEMHELRDKIQTLLATSGEETAAMKGIILTVLAYCRDYISIAEKPEKAKTKMEILNFAIQEAKQLSLTQLDELKTVLLNLNTALNSGHESFKFGIFKREDVLKNAVVTLVTQINKIPVADNENKQGMTLAG